MSHPKIHRCKKCKKRKKITAFSKNQMKKRKSDRKCIHCIEKSGKNQTNLSNHKQKASTVPAIPNIVGSKPQPSSRNPIQSADLSKLDDSMFTDVQMIQNLISANANYQQTSAKSKHTVVCEIGKDCIMIHGDIESIKIKNEWNMKQRNGYFSNVMCAPQIILESLFQNCKSNKVRLHINICTINEFCASLRHQNQPKCKEEKKHDAPSKSSGIKVRVDLSKLNGMFTNKQEIECLIIENNKCKPLALASNGVVICTIGNDCIKISGDCGGFTNIKKWLVDPELNLKQIITNYPDCYWINNMCGPQIILKELVKGCRVLKVTLEIRIVASRHF